MLKRDMFSLLLQCKQKEFTNQRELAGALQFSLGKTNALLQSARAEGFLTEAFALTSAGEEALAPYRVKNAILMAAGMSSRFAPLSYEKPKGLLNVRGEILIERQIRQLLDSGIKEIIVVVGYMKEKFFYLEEKFGVTIVINEDYYRYNNISTLYVAAEYLDNTYICSSDNYFTENVFEPYVYKSYYAAEYSEGTTEEWCMKADDKGRIRHVTIGGDHAWYMVGHAYFDRTFSAQFTQFMRKEYDLPGVKNGYWENVYINHLADLDMEIRPYPEGVLCEFDSLEDLRVFDEDYLNNVDSEIFSHIRKALSCRARDIRILKPLKSGMSNLSFLFEVNGHSYVYRHPYAESSDYVNRANEADAMESAKAAGIRTTCIHLNKETGRKISEYIHDPIPMDPKDPAHVKAAMAMIRNLHDHAPATSFAFDITLQLKKFDHTICGQNRGDFADYTSMKKRTAAFIKDLSLSERKTDGKQVLCHIDFHPDNVIFDKDNNLYLLDWEYAAMADPMCDLGTYVCCTDTSVSEAESLLTTYLGHAPSAKESYRFLAVTSVMAFYWFSWALYQEAIGKLVGKSMYDWYKVCKTYAEAASLKISTEIS